MADDVGFARRIVPMSREKPVSLFEQLRTPAAKPTASPPVPAPPAVIPGDKAESSPPKKSDPLPRPGDPYRACAQYMNRLGGAERLIHFVDRNCYSVGFCYSDLRRISWKQAKEPGGSPLLVLLFAAPELTEVTIEGRNLEDIRYYIGEGMMPWIWEQPSGFRARDDGQAIITAIKFEEQK